MAEEDKPTAPDAGPNKDNATDQARDANSSPRPSADSEKDAIVEEAKARVAAAKEAAQKAAPAAPGAPKAPVKKKEEGPKPTDASAHPLVKKLRGTFDGGVIEASEFLGQLSIRIDRSRIVEVCHALRNDSETPFNYLSDLTCAHYPDQREAPFEVIYNLYSIAANERGARSLRLVRRRVSQSSGLAADPFAARLGRASVAQGLPARVCRESLDGKSSSGIHRGAEGTTRAAPRLWIGNSLGAPGARGARDFPGRKRSDAERQVGSVSEPVADRGPRAGSPRGVVDATGSKSY